MRRGRAFVVLAIALAVAGCGGGTSYPAHASVEGPIGEAADGAWLFQPAGKPKSLVIFFHGQGGRVEATPANHRPWIDHLVAGGSIVVYPRYEIDYLENPLSHAVAGVRAATRRFDADGLPALAIGYSRGGALAVEYAAVAPASKTPVPDAVMSVFPAGAGDEGKRVGLGTIEHSTRLDLLIGDRDNVVGSTGALVVLRRLQAGGFPAGNIHLHFVRSTKYFIADHFAPMQTSAAAKAAFWAVADRLLAGLR